MSYYWGEPYDKIAVPMYVCMYVCSMHVCMYVVCMHVCMYVCMYEYLRIYMFVSLLHSITNTAMLNIALLTVRY